MTIIWLIVWLVQDRPELDFDGQWNNWAIALVVAVFLDVFGGSSSR